MQSGESSEDFGRQTADIGSGRRGPAGLGLAALAMLLMASAASADDVKTLGSFGSGKWQAHTYNEDGRKACYMTGQPIKDEGKYTKRGDIYVMVTHRPAQKIRDEVSFWAGYDFKEESRVEVAIDGQKFEVYPHQEIAWAPDAESDRKLVAAMKAGNTMVVRGTSQRDTATKDTYSLSGFTKAYNTISEACE